MYWFSKPPIERWIAAAVLVLAALVIDLRPRPTTLYPHAAAFLPAGTQLEPSLLEWKPIPNGILPPFAVDGITAVSIDKGSPILGAMLSDRSLIPQDWWIIQLPVPEDARPGSQALLVFNESNQIVESVVARAGSSTAWETTPGSVAVSGEDAALVAAAAARGQITVLISGS